MRALTVAIWGLTIVLVTLSVTAFQLFRYQYTSAGALLVRIDRFTQAACIEPCYGQALARPVAWPAATDPGTPSSSSREMDQMFDKIQRDARNLGRPVSTPRPSWLATPQP